MTPHAVTVRNAGHFDALRGRPRSYDGFIPPLEEGSVLASEYDRGYLAGLTERREMQAEAARLARADSESLFDILLAAIIFAVLVTLVAVGAMGLNAESEKREADRKEAVP